MASRAFPLHATRASTSGAVVAVLALAAVGGGVYLVTQQAGRRPAPKDDPVAQVAALARVEKDTEWIQRAIRERQAILGMTYREVERAKGPPSRKQREETLPESDRANGGVEKWIYESADRETASVLFGSNGLVIQSSDVGDTPRPGQAVRQ
jgi:hypothetical protein